MNHHLNDIFMKSRSIFFYCFIFFVLLNQPAKTVVIRHDRDDTRYQNNATNFPAVGKVIVAPNNFGSGTLISSNWVLTAAHCLLPFFAGVQSTNIEFEVNGVLYHADRWFYYPESHPYDIAINAECDIGLIHLRTAVTNVTPAILYRGNSSLNEELGKVGTLVGFGRTGNGITGTPLSGEGTKRAGQNVIDSIGFSNFYGNSVMLTDFDNPPPVAGEVEFPNGFGGSNDPLDLEGIGATCDSGGGIFIDFGAGQRLAGVFSGAAAQSGPIASGGSVRKYGTYDRYTRVSCFHPWIDYTMLVIDNPAAASSLLPTITIAATDAIASEPGTDTGTFTVTRRGGDTNLSVTVYYTTSGTAEQGVDQWWSGRTITATSDYTLEANGGLLSDYIVIPVGATSASFILKPRNNDASPEGRETAVLTLKSNPFYRIGSQSSATISFDEDLPGASAAPSNLTASAVSASQINLSWTDNTNDETGFKIERKTGINGAHSQIATVGANVTSYTNTSLSWGTQYFFIVRATNATADSTVSNEANATTSIASNAPEV